jgi:hypothetical protein
VRIERIDLEGDGPLRGTLVLPDHGLALWTPSNEIRETALLDAVTAALYGPSADATLAGIRRVTVDVVRDDGARLRLARSLVDGSLRTEGDGAPGADAPGRADGAAPGERLLGLSRDEFLAIAGVPPAGGGSTFGDATLLSLLGRGRGGPAPGAAARIRGDVPAEPDGPASPGADRDAPVERLRRLRHDLATIERDLAVRTQELQQAAEGREELRSERNRFGLLSDAEPADLERLDDLADLLRSTISRREEVARARARFEEEHAGRGLGLEAIEELRGRFGSLDAADVEFLDGVEQASTVRRGNLALARSECRLEETRLADIEREREAAVRAALIPLVGAALGLFGSLLAAVLGGGGLLSIVLLLLGLCGGGAAAWATWRARTRREEERAVILATLDRKRGQIAELEVEGQDAERRAGDLARRARVASPRQLRADWRRWQEAGPVVRERASLAQREREIEEQTVAIRVKLAAFRVGDLGDDASDLATLQTLVDDYRRHFQARGDLGAAEAHCAHLEAELARLESERAGIRGEVEAMLASVGIDPDRELDEAVEMFALRAPFTEGGRRESGELPAPLPHLPEATREAPRSPCGELDTTWMPAVAAAAEAILRRFLPEAREVEIDDLLAPSLRLSDRGPRLPAARLSRELSAAAMDQVWLAVRLAIVETLSSRHERVPLFLDDPWTRADDVRHARGLELALERSERGQVVFRTSQEVRVKWFLHQVPAARDRVFALAAALEDTLPSVAAPASLQPSSPRR